MSEAGVAAVVINDTYRDFVKEVFIDPIRSVLIVDDDFPTLDRMLKDLLATEKQTPEESNRRDNAKRVLDLIEYCREPSRNWLVDVNDGKELKKTNGTQLYSAS